MATGDDNLPPAEHDGSLPFVKRHATGLTVVVFLVVGAVLGVSPLPDRYRPVDLSTPDARQAVLDRVFKQPKMTFTTISAELEAADESDADGAEASDDEEGPDPELLALVFEEQRAEAPRAKKRRGENVTKKVKTLRSIAERLEAPGSRIDNPCIEPTATGCKKTALDPFFAALDALDAKEPGRRADIVTLGNSLIASDHVTDVVRDRLVERFGDGGRGYLLPDRLSKVAGRRVRTGKASDGWEINTFAMKPAPRGFYGYTGSHHESKRKGDDVTWKLKGADRARLHYLDHPKSASFTIDVDGKVLKTVSPSGEPARDRFIDLELPEGGDSLHLVADGAEVVLYGVTLRKSEGGLSFDTIGVPASDSFMYLTADEEVFKRQLAARDPTLMVLMVGGNEIRSMSFKWKTLDEVKVAYAAFIDRIKAAAPNAACLAVAPIDAAKATAAGAQLTTRKEVAPVVAAQIEIAKEKGCAYFNLFEAMGGDGSLHRFHRAGLINDDLVHPKGAGGDVLGQLFADALFESYVSTPRPVTEGEGPLLPPDLFGLRFPGTTASPTDAAHPLVRTVDKLAKLDEKAASPAPVRVGLFGDRHLADGELADLVRARLAARHGGGGRGYVNVADDRDPSVKRTLSGKAHIVDATAIEADAKVGLGGGAVGLAAGGAVELEWCASCDKPDTSSPATVEIAYFPMVAGTAEILLDGANVGTVNTTGQQDPVHFFAFDTVGEKHTVTVKSTSGTLAVFGVSLDLKRAGVVVDNHASPRTTGMTLGRHEPAGLSAQLDHRGYDLVATFWGSEEAWLDSLDEQTYRHYLAASLDALLAKKPAADCVVFGPIDQLGAAVADAGPEPTRPLPPRQKLVENVEREVAASKGCAYFDTYRAMGGRRAIAAWAEKGLASDDMRSLTPAGEKKLGELFVTDLFRFASYVAEKRARDARERGEGTKENVATPGAAPPVPDTEVKVDDDKATLKKDEG